MQVSDFWLHLNVTSPDGLYRSIRDSGVDLYIMETGITSRTEGVEPSLTATELQALAQAGQTAIGYVNVSVPDFNRTYWKDWWVTPSPEDPTDFDFGEVDENAPSWLQDRPVAEGPESGGDDRFGYIVDYSDPEWQQIVIDQAVEIVRAGYGGVFLDDVGRYYTAGGGNDASDEQIKAAAQQMIDLVNIVSREIESINPDAYIAINGDAYLRYNSDEDGAPYTGFAEFTTHVDALMNENYYRLDYLPWTAAGESFTDMSNPNGIDFLAVEWGNVLSDSEASDFLGAFSSENNLIPLLTPNADYDALFSTSQPIQPDEVDASVFRLFQAVFDRAPDAPGFHFWEGLLDEGGLGLVQVADLFILSPEFVQTYGDLDNQQFLTEIYGNVLNRAPDDAGYDFWLNNLETGLSRAELVVGFSDSVEFSGNTAVAFDSWFDVWG